ncbi:MAG: hypothetical protein AB8B53_08215 [Flavobacteriales bacterium]
MKNLTLVALTVLFFSTCSVLDKEEDLPSFIKIDDITLSLEGLTLADGSSTAGSDRTALKEIQVDANGQTIGIFSLPAIVPILESGSVDLVITPIINRDGVSTAKVPYPFYRPYTTIENLTELDTVQITPVVTYLNGLNFWIENFTNSSEFQNNDPSTDGDLVRILTEPFEAPASGFIDLPSDASFFYAETAESFDIPLGKPAFVELHYSSNHPFRIGTLARVGVTDSRSDLVGINPSTNSEEKVWKKLYVNLTDYRSNFSSGANFEIYFRLSKDPGYPEPLVFIDNVKVVY